jgi:hypothetical protein
MRLAVLCWVLGHTWHGVPARIQMATPYLPVGTRYTFWSCRRCPATGKSLDGYPPSRRSR